MTPEQARDIVTLLRAATGGRVNEDTVAYFESSLEDLEYEPALSAATLGARTWRYFPSWADFRDAYRGQQRAREPVGEQRYPVEKPPKYPEWLHVWTWARHRRNPRCLIPFPQQQPHVPEDECLSMAGYETLRQEWIAAGSPKAEHPIPLAKV